MLDVAPGPIGFRGPMVACVALMEDIDREEEVRASRRTFEMRNAFPWPDTNVPFATLGLVRAPCPKWTGLVGLEGPNGA